MTKAQAMKRLTQGDIRSMFTKLNSLELSLLFKINESIADGMHNHAQLSNMYKQSKSSPSKFQNAKADIIFHYMGGKNISNSIPETPKISTEQKELTDVIACKRYLQLFDNAKSRGIDFSFINW